MDMNTRTYLNNRLSIIIFKDGIP